MLALALVVSAATAVASPVELDPSFGTNGRVVTTLPQGPARVQAARYVDGGLLVAKSTAVARYRSDGRLDPFFGEAGIATVPLLAGTEFDLAGLAADDQGRVVVGGTLLSDSQPTYVPDGAASPVRRERAVLVRLLSDGSPDPAFGVGGILVTDLGLPAPVLRLPRESLPPALTVTGLSLDATGRIVLTGSFYAIEEFCRESIEAVTEAFITRLLPDGGLDESFAVGGVRVDPGLRAVGSPLLDRRGRILYPAARYTGCDGLRPGGVGRLDPGGNLDQAFDGDGWRPLPRQEESPRDLALDRQGRILVLGSEPGTPVERPPRPRFKLAALFRLSPSGAIDRSFARAGRALARIPGRHSHFNSLAVDRRNGVVLAGVRIRRVVRPFRNSSFAAARYSPAGRRDRSFGDAGLLETRFGSRSTAAASEVLFPSSNRFLLAGPVSLGALATGQGLALARYRIR
ncbi:MAG TPA: hypothetical protein VKB23_05035 [Solirubrobacterales bacterium]|nr:hypothetical protein [Solirubrobacterales bacterium]